MELQSGMARVSRPSPEPRRRVVRKSPGPSPQAPATLSRLLAALRERQRRRQVDRQLGPYIDLLPRHRVREGQPRRVEELAFQAQTVRVFRTGGRRTPDARSPPGGPGSGGSGPCRAQYSGAPCPGAGARSRNGSAPHAVRRCRSTSACGRVGAARSARRSCPSAPTGGRRPVRCTPAADAGEQVPPSARGGPRCSWRPPADPTCPDPAGARCRRATHPRRRPPAPRAPGPACRTSGLAPGARPHPRACPRRADTDPRTPPNTAPGHPPSPPRIPGASRRIRLPLRPASGGAWARPRRRPTRAPRRSAPAPARASPRRRPGSDRAGSRPPGQVRATSRLCARAFEHPQQDQYPEGDRYVRDIECRPVRQLDPVRHRSTRDPVDQVADRAPDEHSGR